MADRGGAEAPGATAPVRGTRLLELVRIMDTLTPHLVTRNPAAAAAWYGPVRETARDLGVSPAQVAIAWTRSRSSAVIPVVGARRLEQLLDNLGAADLELPAEAIARLEAAAPDDPGFPSAFIRDTLCPPVV